MPSVSRNQQKAMFAAAAGHSTLGIPQKVGADFVAADRMAHATGLPKSAPIAPVAAPPKVQQPKSGLQQLHAALRAMRVPKIP